MKEIKWKEIIRWFWKQRLYLLLVILIFLMRLSLGLAHSGKTETEEFSKFYQRFNETIKEELLKEPQKLVWVGVVTLLMLAGLVIGSILFFTWGIGFMRKPVADSPVVPWSLWDVFRVVILSFFWGQALFIIGLLVVRLWGIRQLNEHVLMLWGTLWMDVLIFFFIMYVTVHQAKGSLNYLGLTFHRCFTNIATGILGYLSSLPILCLTLLSVLITAQLLKYEPPPQPIQEIFLTEKGGNTLFTAVILVSLVGPFFEELFFRGLLYNSLKRRLKPMTSLWITSIIFSAVHANLFGFFPILVLSALLTILYEKTGSLISSVTVHVLHNSLMIGFFFFVKELGGK